MISSDDLAHLVGASRQETDQIIKRRVAQLKSEFESDNKRKEHRVKKVTGLTDVYQSFLHPELTSIEPRGGAGTTMNFHFDDEHDVYAMLIGRLKRNYKKMQGDQSELVLRSVADTVFDYVGGAKLEGDVEPLMKRRYLRMRHIESDKEQVSKGKISLFKGSECAMCVERSAIAHQCFKFLDYDSMLVLSGMTKNGKAVGHAYNLVETGYNEGVLFDSTLVKKVVGDNGEVSYDPIIFRAQGRDDFDSLFKLKVKPVTYSTPREDNVTIDYSSQRVLTADGLAKGQGFEIG